MLTFVTSEKTGDIMMSFAEGDFTLDQVGWSHPQRSVQAFNLLTFTLHGMGHILIAAPAGTGDSEECEQEHNIILKRSYQE